MERNTPNQEGSLILDILKGFGLFYGFMAVLAVPALMSNMANHRGTEEVRRGNHRHVIQYDKRNEGVVLWEREPMFGELNLRRLVDTNYDGVADYINTPRGRLPVNPEQQKLFSDLTSHFYEVNPDKEALLKKKGSIR